MILKKGPYGEFYGCNSYPNCKTTYSVEEFERLEKNYQMIKNKKIFL